MLSIWNATMVAHKTLKITAKQMVTDDTAVIRKTVASNILLRYWVNKWLVWSLRTKFYFMYLSSYQKSKQVRSQ